LSEIYRRPFPQSGRRSLAFLGRLAPLTAARTTDTASAGAIADLAIRTAGTGLRTTPRTGTRTGAGRSADAAGSTLGTTARVSNGATDAASVEAACSRSRIVLLPRASYTAARKPRGGSGPVPASARRTLPLKRRSG